MIREIKPGLSRLEIPLPKNPLRAINSYLIKSDGRSLLIDTGLDLPECRQEMLKDLKTLDVAPENLEFFITHMHSDHLALLTELATDKSTVYFNRLEAALPGFPQEWEKIRRYYMLNGFPEPEIKRAFDRHPGRRHIIPPFKYHILGDGDPLEFGDYHFRCIQTPGHSPGHLCLYERGKKILVSGDHLLLEITPNISVWYEGRNPLKEYLASLEKIYPLDVSLVLPGHGSLFTDHRKRIEELKVHHKERNEETLSILDGHRMDGYRISSLMKWDVEIGSWEKFPSQQKLFATGETLAHLTFLEAEGKVKSVDENNRRLYVKA